MDTGFWNADWADAVGVSPGTFAAAMGVVIAVGFVLWLLGGRLARAGTVFAGFVVGGLAVTSVAVGLASETGVGAWVLAVGVIGAIGGALLSWLLFRLWMGLLAMAVLALVVPAAVLVWNPPTTGEAGASEAVVDAAEEDAGSLVDSLKETISEGVAEAFTAEDVEQAASEAMASMEAGDAPDGEALADSVMGSIDAERVQAIAMDQARRVWDVLKAAWDREMDRLSSWWSSQPAGTRTTVIGGSILGAAAGLLLGLVFPKIMARVQTAMVGAVLMFFPAGVLLHAFVARPLSDATEGSGVEAEAAGVAGLIAYWPGTPRAVLLSLGLITAVGLLLQCTFLRKKADS